MATDQEIRDRGIKFLPLQKYLQSDYQFNEPVVEEEEVTESFGIPNTNAFTNSGGNNFNSSFSNNPYTAQPSGSFVTNRTSYGNSGYLPGTEPQPSRFQPAMDLIGKGIGMAIPGGNFLMGMAKNQSRENRLSATDNAFIDMQLANQEQGPSGNLTTQDKYGYNKVSAFGNYADLVSKNAAKANAKNPDDLTNFDKYYQEKQKEFEDTEDKIDFNNFVRQRSLANKIRDRIKNDPTYNEKFNIHNDAGDKPPPSGGNGGGGAPPGFGITSAGNFVNQFEGGDPGQGQGNSNPTGSPGSKGAGGSDAMGSFKRGGRVGYFFGGRARLQGGGMSMGNESNQTQSANMGGGATGDFSTSEQTVNHNRAMRDNQKPPESPVTNIINAGSELNYLNNLKNLNLPGIALGFGINKFRDFIGNKKTKEEEDKLSALPSNNYFADLNAAQIKQLEGPQKMGKEYGNFSDQEILDNITPFGDEETAPATLKDVQTFYGSNGGLASIL